MPRKLNWKIAGAAGHGIKSIGSIMAKALLRHGWYTYGYDEYPSLIRGGHNTYQLLISDQPVTAPQKHVDILLALNEDGVTQHLTELGSNTLLIKDQITKPAESAGKPATDQAKVLSLPILETAKKLGNPLVQNTILLGVTTGLLGLEDTTMQNLIKAEFGKKQDILDLNLQAFTQGRQLVSQQHGFELEKKTFEDAKLVMDGSEAAGLGAIAAGLQAYFAYPMTPSSPLLHFLAAHQDEYNYLVRQPEDEIAAINLAIGATFAGAKSMVGTAGGGFALMQESLALTGMLELPLVVYVGMRPGPATGLPTWTSQADLRFVIHSGHGEFPKVVLTPGDTKEAFQAVYHAFELSQRFQIPVIVLTDKLLAEADMTTNPLPDKACVPLAKINWQPSQPNTEFFHRYQPTPDGTGLRTLPGIENGFYIANSDEHDPTGLVDESASTREIMIKRRTDKWQLLKKQALPPQVYGNQDSDWMLVSWGSTKGSLLEAMKDLPDIGLCHFTQVWPLSEETQGLLQNKKLIIVENNTTAQFAGLLRQETGLQANLQLLKDDGRPFYPEDIIEFVKKNT